MSDPPYWIRERQNPQLGTYFVAEGQMSKTAAKRYETGSLYGGNVMHRYENEIKYINAIEKLKKAGERIQ